MPYQILKLPQVKSLTGLSRSTIYLKMSRDEFPKPISLGTRAVGWLESDVNGWLERRIELTNQDSKERGVK